MMGEGGGRREEEEEEMVVGCLCKRRVGG